MIFAYGASDPATGSDIIYHGFTKRGNAEVLLISSTHNDEQTLPSNIMKLQFSFNNVILPRNETYYYNEVQKVPDLTSKMHILRVNMFKADFHSSIARRSTCNKLFLVSV